MTDYDYLKFHSSLSKNLIFFSLLKYLQIQKKKKKKETPTQRDNTVIVKVSSGHTSA